MLWFVFQLDNMDEKEQADRLAAAEALYLISTHVGKNKSVQKTHGRGRKKKTNDYAEDITAKRKNEIENVSDVRYTSSVNNNSNRRGRGRRRGGMREGRGARSGGRGGSASPRGRGGKSRQSITDISDETYHRNGNKDDIGHQLKQNSTGGEKIGFEKSEVPQQKSRSRIKKNRTQRSKSNSSGECIDHSHASEADDNKPHQAIGFTGAAISIIEPQNRRSSIDSEHHVQTHSFLPGSRQVGLTSWSLSSAPPMFNLPSMNLSSFTTEVNLPSIPLEIGSLQLSSQPTPNLSSLGDMAEGVMEDECSSTDRKKSEKFLPLKKRKLQPSEAEVRPPTPSVEASLSDSEERSEPAKPVRASFTVQAPPVITMQTLMEIKTALTADDDGDLPLHIAVVHENMRMVTKLVTLMKIAGKGVDKFNKQQQTPLHLAVKLNFLTAIDVLLKYKANVNAVDCTGSSCIHMAVQGKSIKCLTLLLESCPDADLNVRNFDGLTPLHIAVDNGDLQQVELLLKYNADIDVTDGKSGRTALFRAAESNQKSMVELLLNKGANPDVPNYAGVTTAMAAQGRNLHGVLKLLGSVATDKFADYETKPTGLTLESKPTPVYLGFSSPGGLTVSHPSPASGGSMSRHGSQEIACLIEPKSSTETAETPSNETKVFHNVFVLSQNKGKEQSKSMSVPTSPEVKMEITEDKDADTSSRSGLLSLPDSIFCTSVRESGDQLITRKERAMGHGGMLATSKAKLHVPIGYSRVFTNSGQIVHRDEPKPVFLRIVPSQTSANSSDSIIGRLASPPVEVTSAVSGLMSRSSRLSSELSSNATSPKVSVTPPSSSNDTVTLTGMQARLFQMLLKKYNIDPGNEASVGSSESRVGHALPQFPPSVSPSQPLSSLPAVSPLVTAVCHSPGILPKSSSQLSLANVISFEQKTDSGKPFQSMEKTNAQMSGELAKPAESPLNLSTTYGRQSETSYGDKGSINSSVDLSKTVCSASSENIRASLFPGILSDQSAAKGKVNSIGVRRISDGNKEIQSGSEQFEMYVMPPAEQVPLTVLPGQIGSSNFSALSTSRAFNMNISQEGSVAKQPELTLSRNVTNVAGVSMKTASKVRDYLSQQNQVRLLSLPSASSQPVVSTPPVSQVHSSVPTVLDFAGETAGLTQKKHVTTLSRNLSTAVSTGKVMSFVGTPITSTVLLPAQSVSPIFLHQGQIIDLSISRIAEPKTLSTLTLPSLSITDSEPRKIIGFSGAVISVAPSKPDQMEKRLSKEALPKENYKKRGRKSHKTMLNSAVSGESGLGKINSETDQKLKRFLGARKMENTFSVLPEMMDEGCSAPDDEADSVGMEDSELIATNPERELSEGPPDQTYKTVGIFSGSVQHIKVGKKTSISTSPATLITTPLSAPSTASLPEAGEDAEVRSNEKTELTNTFSPELSFFVSSLTNSLSKYQSKESLLESSPQDSTRTIEDTNKSSDYLNLKDSHLRTGVNSLFSEALSKSKKLSTKLTKPPLHAVNESNVKIATVVNKNGKSSQVGLLTNKPNKKSDTSLSGGAEMYESSQAPVDSCSDSIQNSRGNVQTSVQFGSCQEGTACGINDVQIRLPEDKSVRKQRKRLPEDKSFRKHKKHLRKKPLDSLWPSKVVVHVNTYEDVHSESEKTPVPDSADEGVTEDSNMEVEDVNNEDSDEPSALVIEEHEEMN